MASSRSACASVTWLSPPPPQALRLMAEALLACLCMLRRASVEPSSVRGFCLSKSLQAVAILTMAILTMAILTMALLTMAMLTMPKGEGAQGAGRALCHGGVW